MLALLIVLSITASTAFNISDGDVRNRRQILFVDRAPSPMSFFQRPYWTQRQAYFNYPQERIIDDDMETTERVLLLERMRPSSRQNPSSKQVTTGVFGTVVGTVGNVVGNTVGNVVGAVGNLDGNVLNKPMRRNSQLSTLSPCVASNGVDQGICLAAPVCSYNGGNTAGGNCRMGLTCCINQVNYCGAMVNINNTYWQSPSSVSSVSSCGMTINMNARRIRQKRTCQIRLDFVNFALAQPSSESVCNVDSFQVIGAVNKIPVICGNNDGQHMYLFVPPSTTSVQLVMSFGSSVVQRSWRIRVALLPCDSDIFPDYLAPNDCLQYFTAPTGVIKSFNWMDTAATATRQLANQDYHICFRTELIGQSQVATTMCLSQCQVSAGVSFGLSGTTTTSQSLTPTDCSNDYMVFAGGYQLPITTPLNPRDRFCGNVFAQGASATTPDTICSTAKSFRVLYKTNGDETVAVPQDTNTALGNQGFCLQYQQRLS